VYVLTDVYFVSLGRRRVWLGVSFRASLLESSSITNKIDRFVHTDGDRKTVRLSYDITPPLYGTGRAHYWC
jgi:hypothetical protein